MAGRSKSLNLALFPSWPLHWLANARQMKHAIPLLYGPGPLLLLAVVRWRDPRARLLLIMAAMLQRFMFCDQLPLLLVARDFKQQMRLVIASWLAWLATVFLGPTWGWPALWQPGFVDGTAGWVVGLLYGAAVGVVLESQIEALFKQKTICESSPKRVLLERHQNRVETSF